MGPNLDLKGESENAMEVSYCKQGISSKISEKRIMSSPNKYVDDKCAVEGSLNTSAMVPGRSEDMEVNVTDDVNSDDRELLVGEYAEETESSSSFGDTESSSGSGAVSNGLEVESELRDDGASILALDRFSDLLNRKKKLTSHWRSFVRPLMWRLKWIELKIRALEEQSAKYSQRITEYGQKKDQELQKLIVDDLSVKATPLSIKTQRVHMVKRRKRKHLEEEIDIPLYMSHHNILSYHVNKRPHADGAHLDHAFGNSVKPDSKTNRANEDFGVDGGWSCLENKDDEMLEEILWNMEQSKLQLHALKIRVDKVVNENADRISASGCFVSLSDAPISSALKASHHFSGEVGTGSLCMPSLCPPESREGDVLVDSGVSGYGEISTFSDTIAGTDRPHLCVPSENAQDEILIYSNNHLMKEETGVSIQPAGTSQPSSDLLAVKQELVTPQGKRATQPRSRVRSISMLSNPKRKRKSARRKGRSGRWTRRSSA